MTLNERFWSKVDKTGDCWIWKGCIIPNGYGQFWLNGRMQNAHRVSWELTNGPIPKGLEILHKCDNPPCVNPSHLWAGTQTENQQDSIRKGRFVRGVKNGHNKLTPEQVLEIRKTYIKNTSSRKGHPLPFSQRTLAKKFHVSRGTITCILKGRAWTWLNQK